MWQEEKGQGQVNSFKPDYTSKPDRTEEAFRLNESLKGKKWKGEIHLLHDGSGKVAKVKKVEYV